MACVRRSLSVAWQHEKSIIGMTVLKKIGASDQERLRWPDQVPVEGIDGQVAICSRYSRGTKISQQPGEVASVGAIALMLWRA